MNVSRRALLLRLLPGALALPALAATDGAVAQTYYDVSGNVIVVNPGTLAAPVTVYDAYRRPVVVYPAGPAYAPSPVYGPAGVVGQSRRVARRTSRRTAARWN